MYSIEKVLKKASQAVAASQTNQVVSDLFKIADPAYLIIDITVNPAVVATGITAKLQDSMDNTLWVDKKTVSITAVSSDTLFVIKLLPDVAGDQASLPLRPTGRIVVSTGAGDSCTIKSVKVLQVVR